MESFQWHMQSNIIKYIMYMCVAADYKNIKVGLQ